MPEEIEDDEITIDFSKIKGFFKKLTQEKEPRKRKKKEAKEEESSDEEDDEIAIDFSKIKSIFKPKKEGKAKKEKEEDDEEELSVDWSKIKEFGKKHSVLLLILIPLFLSIFFRLQPAYLPITDDWAANTVYNNIQNQIRAQVSRQYPNLPDENKNKIIQNQFQQVLKQNKDQIKQQIQAASNYFKTRLQNEKGNTYLLAIDPYFWARHAENVYKQGHPGDILVDGKPYDTHMIAPLGRFVPGDMFHAYFEGYLLKFVRALNPNADPLGVFFYVPIFLSALAVIPAFFIARRIGGNVGGLFAAIVVGVHGSFISRTAGGFADTDAYNVVFPLFVAWLFLEAFEARNTKKRLLLGGGAGIVLGIYSWSWLGWWYILDFILAASGIYLIYLIAINWDSAKKNPFAVLKTKGVRNTILLVGVFIASAWLMTSIIYSPRFFIDSAVKAPIGFIKFKEVGVGTVWPNVYTTVAEQNASSLRGVINAMGGKFLFLLAVLGALFTLVKKDEEGKVDIKYALLILIWIAATTYASIKGVRFTLLLVPAFSVGFGIFAGSVYHWITRWASKEFSIEPGIIRVVAVLLLALLLWQPVTQGWRVAKSEIPSMNDAWWTALTKIKQNSEPNAIINSWWDFGHWFKYVADRPVTFDGTTQNLPQAHWIGKVLMTEDEEEAIGILRMLDCGATNAFDELDRINKDPLKTINQLYEMFRMGKKEAEELLLENGLTKEQAAGFLKNTHCEPPEDFFIASADMIGKSGVWAHFGSWNFTKSTMYNLARGKPQQEGIALLKERFKLDDASASTLYYEIQTVDANNWIAPWPSYASGLIGCSRRNNTVKCGNGLVIEIKSGEEMDAYINTPQGKIYPKRFAYPTNTTLKIKEYEGRTLRANNGRPLGVTLIRRNNNYQVLLASPELVGSMFTRLFFMDAHGLKYFQPFTHERSFTGGDIYVYKVNWTGGRLNLLPGFVKKTVVRQGDTVTVSYLGYLDDGRVFDASMNNWDKANVTSNTALDELKNDKLLTFQTGAGKVLAGFEKNILGMRLGEEKEFTVPPEEGYGTDPSRHPLANQNLHFKVRVEKII